MEDLVETRADLELAYVDANDAIVEARDNASAAKAAVIAFDEEHPEVMENAKAEANKRKFDAGQEERKAREATEAEDGAE